MRTLMLLAAFFCALAGVPVAIGTAGSLSSPDEHTDEVNLVHEGGVFEIPVQINGAITLKFIIDSGAADVQIPIDVFSTLIRADTIVPDDIIGPASYTIANGATQKTIRFRIRELKIGHFVLKNVAASVGSSKSDLLLGQSFLTNFDSWTFDNRQHVLKLVAKSTDTERNPASTAESAATELRAQPLSMQNAIVCGKAIEYTSDPSSIATSWIGVWTGHWNNSGQLCGALIVRGISSDGSAEVIYVYGPTRPGTRFSWTQQHRVGQLTGDTLSFSDNQGSTFRFSSAGSSALDASFTGGSGSLHGVFRKSP